MGTNSTPDSSPSGPARGAPSGSGSGHVDNLVPGSVIAERYRLLRKLGEGGMGAVFLAEHIHMRKRFALKILLPEAMASAEMVARFEREAVAAGNIDHPGVCAATDFGRLDDGSFFLVLEFVDGKNLRSLMNEGAMPPERAFGLARQVLGALAAAHGKGVIHRDIKPENVMVTSGGVVKVLDFGIAKVDATLGNAQSENLTRVGAIYGTPLYMAPEQAMGKRIDHRVDLYALGIMLHEMITGEPPFDGEGIILLAQHVNRQPPPLVSPLGANVVTTEHLAVVSRLLAKAPEDRPATAALALAEIDRLGIETEAPSSRAYEPTSKPRSIEPRVSSASDFETVVNRGSNDKTRVNPLVTSAAATGYPLPPPPPPPLDNDNTSAHVPLQQRLAPATVKLRALSRAALRRLQTDRKAALAVGVVLLVIFLGAFYVCVQPSHGTGDDDAEPNAPRRSSSGVTPPAPQFEPDGHGGWKKKSADD